MEKENYSVLTKEELVEEMAIFKKVFPEIRILKESDVKRIYELKYSDSAVAEDTCAGFFGKATPCKNCVALQAYEDKSKKTKIEIVGNTLYEIIGAYVTVDGEPCVVELIRPLEEDSLLETSVTQVKNRLEDYYSRAYTDVLTGLYNRRYYEEKLKDVHVSAGVALIDVDDFKLHNDYYGHNAGDAVLSAVAERVGKELSESDRFIRFGGDEFLLVLFGKTKKQFYKSLEKIVYDISETKVDGFEGARLSVSVGGVMIKPNEKTGDAVKRADKLMYLAKKKKNSVITEDEEDGAIVSALEKPMVMVVDDSEFNREMLSEILSSEYEIIEASGGEQCIALLRSYGYAVSAILLDIIMPGLNGFDVLEYMKLNNMTEDIPVIAITGDESDETVRKAYELGVSDYVKRPFDAKVVYMRVANAIKMHEKQKSLISALSKEMREKEKNGVLLIELLSEIVEYRGVAIGEHVKHIVVLTKLMLGELMTKTKKYALTSSDVFLISTAAALHDIGKCAIDQSIVRKEGLYTPEEYEKMKMHTRCGAKIISDLKEYESEPLVKYAHDICLWHHERFDGNGYPDGLVGDEIPIAAQVVSVCDVFDALVSERSYKKAYDAFIAIEMIKNCECGKFNPVLMECLEGVKDEFIALANEWKE